VSRVPHLFLYFHLNDLISLQVNHLATALLSLLLLPRMAGTASSHGTCPRISIVASGSHAHANIHNDDDVLKSDSPLKTMSGQKFTTSK
jgi:retinol dehydrogenase 12